MKSLIRSLPVLLIALLNQAALACPFCKDSVPNSDAQSASSLPGGMNTSVYFMLVGLFVVMGLVGFVAFKGVRDTNNYHAARRGFPLE